MLAGTLKLAPKYDYLSEKFKKAYAWLQENDIQSLKDGRYDITDGVFALVQRYETLPFAKAKFEAHNDYFDIQYLAAGHETFNVCPRDGLKETEAKPENDLYFYETPAFFTSVNLAAGDLAVVAPEEAHEPRVAYQEKPEAVVKVVVKVKL